MCLGLRVWHVETISDFEFRPPATSESSLAGKYFGSSLMTLEEEILSEHSRRQTDRIARWIGGDRQRYRELIGLLLHGEPVFTQRAAWIISVCHDAHPELIVPHLSRVLKKMQEPDVHDALKRNVVRLLQNCEIPESQLGTVASLCFDYLAALDTPVAIRANAMTVLLNISEREPDLKRELRTSIELMLPYCEPAIVSRARMVMKRLDKDLAQPSSSSQKKKARLS